jgi:hypothetical protein
VVKAAPANTCRYCAAPLDGLAQRRGTHICGAARCRHQAAHAHTVGIKEKLRAAAPAAACSQVPHLERDPAALVWLEHCEPQIVPVSEHDREHHRAYLESVIAERIGIDRSRLAGSTADDIHPQGARLCGQCRGRCCAHGAKWRAFIDLPVLEQWQQEHPSRSLADAVDAYVSMLPAEHVQGACLFQTAKGCAMPRNRRADICNGFACEALEQVQRVARTDPACAVVAITFHKDHVERAALIEADQTHPLALETPAAPRIGC